jgi:hypothetical protein
VEEACALDHGADAAEGKRPADDAESSCFPIAHPAPFFASEFAPSSPSRPRPFRLLVIAPFGHSGAIDYQQAATLSGLASLRRRLRRAARVAAETNGASVDAPDMNAELQATRTRERRAAIRQLFPAPEDAWVIDLLTGDQTPRLNGHHYATASKANPERDDILLRSAAERAFLDSQVRFGGFPGGLDVVVFPPPRLETRQRAPAPFRQAPSALNPKAALAAAIGEAAAEAVDAMSDAAVQAVRSAVALSTVTTPPTRRGAAANTAEPYTAKRAPWKLLTDETSADALMQLMDAVEASLAAPLDSARRAAFGTMHGQGYTFGFRLPRLRSYGEDKGKGGVQLDCELANVDRCDRLAAVTDAKARGDEKDDGVDMFDDAADDAPRFGGGARRGATTPAERRLVDAGATSPSELDEVRRLIDSHHFDAILYAGVDILSALETGRMMRDRQDRAEAPPGDDAAVGEPPSRPPRVPATLPPLDDGGVEVVRARSVDRPPPACRRRRPVRRLSPAGLRRWPHGRTRRVRGSARSVATTRHSNGASPPRRRCSKRSWRRRSLSFAPCGSSTRAGRCSSSTATTTAGSLRRARRSHRRRRAGHTRATLSPRSAAALRRCCSVSCMTARTKKTPCEKRSTHRSQKARDFHVPFSAVISP